MNPFIQLIRVHNWIKNVLIFAPLVFAGLLFDTEAIAQSAVAFVAFCFTASAVYILNDYVDREKDRLHPRKKHRPIASGAISPNVALGILVIMLALGVVTALSVNENVLWLVLGYAAMNVAYSFELKHVVIIDVMIIATGFVLRIFVGSAAIGEALSPWIIMCIFFATLFLGLTKRRQELLLTSEPKTYSQSTREVLDHYSIDFVDKLITISLSATLITYALYTFLEDTHANSAMVYTIPFVVFGMFRYLYFIHHKTSEDDPVMMIGKDIPLLINTGLWVLISIVILY